VLAFASASHGSDGSLPVQDHTQGIERPCTYDSDSGRSESSHSAAPNTSDPYTLQCASTISSFRHSEESQGTDHLRVDISRRVEEVEAVAADAEELADDPTLDEI